MKLTAKPERTACFCIYDNELLGYTKIKIKFLGNRTREGLRRLNQKDECNVFPLYAGPDNLSGGQPGYFHMKSC